MKILKEYESGNTSYNLIEVEHDNKIIEVNRIEMYDSNSDYTSIEYEVLENPTKLSNKEIISFLEKESD